MTPLPPRASRLLLALAGARLWRRTVRVRFLDAGPSTAERTLSVLALAFDPPRWLAACWSVPRRSLRVLDVARVLSVRIERRRGDPGPPGFDPLDFGLRHLLDPGAGTRRLLRLEVSPRTARLAAVLVPGSRVVPVNGGWVCEARTSSPATLLALLSSLEPRLRLDSRCLMPPRPGYRQKSTEARLLGLAAWILERSEPVTRRQIYEAFPDDYRGSPEAAERKLSRDKDALVRLGFRIGEETGDGSSFTIDARSCALPAIEFTPEEAALLWTAGTSALRLSLHPLRDELESALRKLVVGASGLPPRAAATEELAALGAPDTDGHLEAIIDGWERRRRVAIRYFRPATGETLEREVDVYGWANRRGEWLFAGHCHLRDAVRVFYVSRLRGARAARGARDGSYRIPAGFDIRRWSRQQVWDYEVHPPRSAAVRLRGALARIARQLLPGASVTTDEAGARVARLEVRNLPGLVRQCLAWGPDAELLEPEDGRAMAREILDGLVAWRVP